MLDRILEPEVMDTAEDALEYDTMDHSIVNAQFVTDFLAVEIPWLIPRLMNRDDPPADIRILDLGTGTAQIPIELAHRSAHGRITAVDAAECMLAVARQNVNRAGLTDQIEFMLADSKRLPFAANSFDVVISNSIVHHIPDPRSLLAEAIRVTTVGGLLFHRDLARPDNEMQLQDLVKTYAGDATSYQRKLFDDSLRAALTLDEIRDLVVRLGFRRTTVLLTSDRHWTWAALKPD
jgi:ubiquinone/menaquinone biosynthesis C-methylase UbiE